jgi:hypothetical protein
MGAPDGRKATQLAVPKKDRCVLRRRVVVPDVEHYHFEPAPQHGKLIPSTLADWTNFVAQSIDEERRGRIGHLQDPIRWGCRQYTRSSLWRWAWRPLPSSRSRLPSRLSWW